MPSDERVATALDAVSRRRESFRSSLAVTIEEVRGLLETRETSPSGRGQRLAGELGSFAAGRIDASRLAEVLLEPHRVGTTEAGHIERALETLRSLQGRGDDAYVASPDPGESLVEAVDRALAGLGRGFGAARVVELVRDGRYRGGEGASIEGFPFRRWNRAERGIAPPLVVRLDGRDLCVGGLARFLDGVQTIVLLVEGETPPAALARLITPGVLVVQTDDPADLARLAEADGPAIAALVPESAARFVHTPMTARRPAELVVERWPEADPDRPIGERSVFQQREELRQLRALARLGSTAGEPGVADRTGAATSEGGAGADPAGRLAAWLLRQMDVSDLTGGPGAGAAPRTEETVT